MIALIIFFIGFLVASTGYLGGDLIYALDVVENWFLVVFVCASLIAGFVVLLFMCAGTALVSRMSRLGGVWTFTGLAAGSFMGFVVAGLMLLKIGIQLILVYWLMGDLNPELTHFDDISIKQTFAFVILLILSLIPTITTKKQN